MVSNEFAAPRRRRLVWWVAATVCLLLGFADLARGGETIAPVLLILGYCVLIPIAILQ
jgi:membrane-bound ClpP family serine protease